MKFGEDIGGFARGWGCRGELVPADADRHVAQRAKRADDAADGVASGVLEMSADGEGSEHDGEVRVDRVLFVMEHGPGAEIGLRHPERRLDLEQVVIGRDDRGRGDGGRVEVGHVALVIRNSG